MPCSLSFRVKTTLEEVPNCALAFQDPRVVHIKFCEVHGTFAGTRASKVHRKGSHLFAYTASCRQGHNIVNCHHQILPVLPSNLLKYCPSLYCNLQGGGCAASQSQLQAICSKPVALDALDFNLARC